VRRWLIFDLIAAIPMDMITHDDILPSVRLVKLARVYNFFQVRC
jgi:hypothetical protein